MEPYFDVTHYGHEESFVYYDQFSGRWSKAVRVLIVGKDYPLYFSWGNRCFFHHCNQV